MTFVDTNASRRFGFMDHLTIHDSTFVGFCCFLLTRLLSHGSGCCWLRLRLRVGVDDGC